MSEQLIGCGPLVTVDGPPPFPPRYGLLQAAAAAVAGVRLVPNDAGPERWLNGVEMLPYPQHAGAVHSPYNEGSPTNEKEVGDPVDDAPQFWPVTVYVADRCNAYAVGNDAAYRDRIMLQLAAVESARVARSLLTGDGFPAGSPRLSDGGGTFPNNDFAVSLPRALSMLEGEIAASGRGGVIHMSPIALTLLAGQGHIIEPDPLNLRGSDVLRTKWGTLVIPDAGYVVGSTPTGHAAPSPSQEWLYATGPVDVRRTETFINPETVAEALDRGLGATAGNTNTISYQAERHYLVAWDNTIQAAVLATLA